MPSPPDTWYWLTVWPISLSSDYRYMASSCITSNLNIPCTMPGATEVRTVDFSEEVDGPMTAYTGVVPMDSIYCCRAVSASIGKVVSIKFSEDENGITAGIKDRCTYIYLRLPGQPPERQVARPRQRFPMPTAIPRTSSIPDRTTQPSRSGTKVLLPKARPSVCLPAIPKASPFGCRGRRKIYPVQW